MEEETIIEEILRKRREGKIRSAEKLYGKCRSRTYDVRDGEGRTTGYGKK